MKRPKLKQENPSLSVGSMAKQLSSAWKLMTPEQKKPYDEMASRDKQRLASDLSGFEWVVILSFFPLTVKRGDHKLAPG